ncbi:MAG: hypothetical protein U0W40_07810 [Acidimicrobiia bacterium]
MVLSDAGAVKDLQDALGVTIRNKAALRTEAWRQLGVRLATAPSEVSDNDVLSSLVDAGFPLLRGPRRLDSLSAFPGRAASVTFVTGTTAKVPSDIIVVPVANGIHAASVPLVIADQWVDVPDGPEARSRPAAGARQRPRAFGLDGRRPRPAAGPDHCGAGARRPPADAARRRPLRLRRRHPTDADTGGRVTDTRRRGRRVAALVLGVVALVAALGGLTGAAGDHRARPTARARRACSSIISLPTVTWADVRRVRTQTSTASSAKVRWGTW